MKNFSLRDWFNSLIPQEVKLVKSEFAGKVIPGTDKVNVIYRSFITSGRVENKYDHNLKLMVMTKSNNRENGEKLVSGLTEWFRHERETDINSSKYSEKMASIVSNMRQESLYGAKTSFGFAISNGEGDVVLYNVGDLRLYLKPIDEVGVHDVTFMGAGCNAYSYLEESAGSYFYYSGIEEIYMVPEDIIVPEIEAVSAINMSAKDKVRILLSDVDQDTDIGANVLRIGKR